MGVHGGRRGHTLPCTGTNMPLWGPGVHLWPWPPSRVSPESQEGTPRPEPPLSPGREGGPGAGPVLCVPDLAAVKCRQLDSWTRQRAVRQGERPRGRPELPRRPGGPSEGGGPSMPWTCGAKKRAPPRAQTGGQTLVGPFRRELQGSGPGGPQTPHPGLGGGTELPMVK